MQARRLFIAVSLCLLSRPLTAPACPQKISTLATGPIIYTSPFSFSELYRRESKRLDAHQMCETYNSSHDEAEQWETAARKFAEIGENALAAYWYRAAAAVAD